MSESQSSPFTLGTLVFDGFETPPSISYDTQQTIVMHRLPGGSRVFDTMGVDYKPVSWSGLLIGPQRYVIQTQMLAMMRLAKPVSLKWGRRSLPVLINKIEFKEMFYQIRYQVEVVLDIKLTDTNTSAHPATGDGSTPSTPAIAKDSGQTSISQARAAAPSNIPIPPIPPGSPPPVPSVGSSSSPLP